jgi:hypothetical protein
MCSDPELFLIRGQSTFFANFLKVAAQRVLQVTVKMTALKLTASLGLESLPGRNRT